MKVNDALSTVASPVSAEEILNTFYDYIEYKKNKYGWQFKEDLNFYKGKILNYDFLDLPQTKFLLF